MTGKSRSKSPLLDNYSSRLSRQRRLAAPETLYDRSWLANVFTALFVGIDMTCLYTVWNTVQTESAIMIILLCIGCAVCLDVPLAIAGTAFKSYFQKMRDGKSTAIIMALSVITFLSVFVFALWFRLETADITFGLSDSSTMTNSLASSVATADTDSSAVFVAALFSGVIPFCTSIASFVISFFAANPLAAKIAQYDKALISLDAQISDAQQACSEVSRLETHKARLINRVRDLYRIFCEDCDEQGRARKHAVGQILMERATDPDEITRITIAGEALNLGAHSTLSDINDLASYQE